MFQRLINYFRSRASHSLVRHAFPTPRTINPKFPISWGTISVMGALCIGKESMSYKKIDIEPKELALDAEDFKAKPTSTLSDHLPISDKASTVLSWNTLQRCETWQGGKDKQTEFFNNGFGKTETEEQYRARRGYLLSYATTQLVKNINSEPGQTPIHVICLQELQGSEQDLVRHVDGGSFRLARLDNKPDSLSQAYGDHCKLVMLHSDQVEPLEKCDLSSLNLCHPERYQAIKFRDKPSRAEFIVVNVHQDWKSVEQGKKPGLKNLRLIQEKFSKLPCLITGDFNTQQLQLAPSDTKVILGNNTNIVWDATAKRAQAQLGACDHIIMNDLYLSEFLPKLQSAAKNVVRRV